MLTFLTVLKLPHKSKKYKKGTIFSKNWTKSLDLVIYSQEDITNTTYEGQTYVNLWIQHLVWLPFVGLNAFKHSWLLSMRLVNCRNLSPFNSGTCVGFLTLTAGFRSFFSNRLRSGFWLSRSKTYSSSTTLWWKHLFARCLPWYFSFRYPASQSWTKLRRPLGSSCVIFMVGSNILLAGVLCRYPAFSHLLDNYTVRFYFL